MADRELNWAGHSIETIAAMYETDAALADCGGHGMDPYFRAACAAELRESSLDRQTGTRQ